MKMHANARLSLKGRELLIERVENAGWSLSSARRGGQKRAPNGGAGLRARGAMRAPG